MLNHQCPLVRRIAEIAEPDLAASAIEGLYGQALLLSRRPLRPAEHAQLNKAFLGLLEYATHRSGASADEGSAKEEDR